MPKMDMISPCAGETNPLLFDQSACARESDSTTTPKKLPSSGHHDTPPYRILPLALLASLAMSATAATAVFAYATLLCADPKHCRDSEQNVYAGTVAAATTMANLCGLFALGPLEKLSRSSQKKGLAIWFICRSMSVFLLALGVFSRSLMVALFGRVFEGLASDNILHFNLNAIYVQQTDRSQTSRTIGISLGLYMVGISISPFVAGLFDDFAVSFAISLALFGSALTYLTFAVAGGPRSSVEAPQSNAGGEARFKFAFSPLAMFYKYPFSILSGVAMLVYNITQAYAFEGIMVYTTLRFGFSGRQNGRIISIVHAIGALYLLVIHFILPRARRTLENARPRCRVPEPDRRSSQVPDLALTALSLLVYSLFFVFLALADESWKIYPIIPLSAVGLAAPAFMKSHFVSQFPQTDGPRALAALTIMETIGGLLAPAILGGFQAIWRGRGFLFVGAIIVALSAVVFLFGAIFGMKKRPMGT